MNPFWLLLLLCCLTIGCGKVMAEKRSEITLAPTVHVAKPELRTIRRSIAQPGVIEPYEQTAIYSKVAGFVEKWHVDIGTKVRKDELLVEVLVPELADEHRQKEALVEQEAALVNQADKLVQVAESNHQAAADAVAEARANITQYVAAIKYWEGQLNRLRQVGTAINPGVLPETQQQIDQKQAELEAANSAVKTKESLAIAAAAQVEKAKADLAAAQAQVKVAQAEERRLAAMCAYTKIAAPYDGVVIERNVNTGDFVRPASGDASGNEGGSGGHSAPLFVIARTDPMTFVIGVPEVDAPYVGVGSKATLRLQALANREFDVEVTRTSLALQNQSRTLQAEIDLPNPHNELLPGMYAYGSIEIQRPNVRAVPASSLVQIGNRTCCFVVNGDKAVRTQLQAGVTDGQWTEVAKRRTYPTSGEAGAGKTLMDLSKLSKATFQRSPMASKSDWKIRSRIVSRFSLFGPRRIPGSADRAAMQFSP